MKPRQKQYSLRRAAALLALSLGIGAHVFSSQAIAQDQLLAETEGILAQEQVDSEVINIDGQYQRESAADRVTKMRKRLEKKNEDMVQKKIEDIRIKQEKELAKGLKKAFTRGMQAMSGDAVSTQKSAVQKVEKKAPKPKDTGKKNRIIPTFGVSSISGESIEFESKVDAGIAFETDVSRHFAAGIGLGFMNMNIQDLNPNYGGYTFNQSYSYNNQQGREMDYKQFSLDLNGKFYFVADSKIRPYGGVGLGYRRTSLKYQESDPFYSNNYYYNYGTLEDVSYKNNYMTASAQLGADMHFTEMSGARLELAYTKGRCNDDQ